MDRLDGSFNRGFTAGLQKALEIMQYISDDMRVHKRKLNAKAAIEILQAAINGRETLRENPEAFVRCLSSGGYEVYNPQKRGHYET